MDKRRQRNNTLQNTSDYKKNVLDSKRLEKRGKTSPPCVGCRCRCRWHWIFFLFNLLFYFHFMLTRFLLNIYEGIWKFWGRMATRVDKRSKLLTKFKRKIGYKKTTGNLVIIFFHLGEKSGQISSSNVKKVDNFRQK